MPRDKQMLCHRVSSDTVFFSLLFPFINCNAIHSTINMEVGNTPVTPLVNGNHGNHSQNDNVLNILPLNTYYFDSKPPLQLKDMTIAERIQRFKSNYSAYGLRTCVGAVLMVELFNHPHILLLQEKNSIYKLPGGRLRPGESDIEGLKRKLSKKLSAGNSSDWEVGECLGMWWRSDFDTLLYPFLPPSGKNPKECKKIFLVKLPEARKFTVPRNLKILAVPLCQIHDNHKTYGAVISGVPQLLSKFTINIVQP